MLLHGLLLLHFFVAIDGAILKCDFETTCLDFVSDSNWGVTDGFNPRPLDHDHTWNNQSGQYLFFIPRNGSRFSKAQIKTPKWLQPSTDRAVCFQLWYYTSTPDVIFTVELLQGDDLALTRIIAEVEGDQPNVTDWTLVHVRLPPEQIQIAIRSNATSGDLVFDDLLVDYCDEPRPPPVETLFECDFESSCDEQLRSPLEYPYQWSTVQASTAAAQESQAPAIDYTFSNRSGHYTWLANGNQVAPGKVGYLETVPVFNITEEHSFCLSFQYYLYGYSGNNLFVYTSAENGLQRLWPIITSSSVSYSRDKWAWGTINLPVGNYSLLFRMATIDALRGSFALDNIAVTSCDYPAYSLDPSASELLSFSAHFDDGTMDGVVNTDDPRFGVKFNFTLMTSHEVPNPELGPTHDHTTNSSTGGFLYWDRHLPFVPGDSGLVHPSQRLLQNLGMCLRFAYYVKSTAVNSNSTQLSITSGGCYGATLWSMSLDDSQGWQVIIVPVKAYTCGETYYFWAGQNTPVKVAVAFDDIEVAQCSSFDPPTTTTTITTTTTTTSTATSTTTSTVTSTTASTTTTGTSTTSTSTTTTDTTTTTTSITTEKPGAASFSTIDKVLVIQMLVFLLLSSIRNV